MADFVVIKTGGKQYKVVLGQQFLVEKNKQKEGSSVDLQDLISGEKVSAKILGNIKGSKIKILKFKNKTRYKRQQGHRQNYTKIVIEKIGAKTAAKPAAKVEKELKKESAAKAKSKSIKAQPKKITAKAKKTSPTFAQSSGGQSKAKK
ncbi:MAG: 50S ribosomal protein L21 [Candidatus Nealsonbacteria bacterium CG23_combo_of_CG06-09_8_20_14_all_40_13]|uniref:Large ribosomal subunit protein bL21 n=1 Tax=Candidatus Nealsonbacteria bacterium CG23_combo_of_CG06-09_8_20_14_all_40_13 TaxID=1974724 RepID=A0A2G9YTV7_9BACT|nr:MAG: 50S ribosomal protein L21 [Candidatus Nealsonbacteria bacterium CG23_combo_of_CG06-09_8_20_14_all_40_13]PIR71015.1 MAG: 50S ribosomal protein L21 [Candidatus Nealsonbacteria bacterium CG10_big_fil_rev_8_21_14_0_10_40_24]PIU43109.1 MAG: 50S ribosomal protein L21 [Candidatus Nealsonbacteria bacterium CG07_land_8_20_14_0_80_40_10]